MDEGYDFHTGDWRMDTLIAFISPEYVAGTVDKVEAAAHKKDWSCY